MAVQIIAFPVVARQNTNDGSSAMLGHRFFAMSTYQSVLMQGRRGEIVYLYTQYSYYLRIRHRLKRKKLRTFATAKIIANKL